MFKLSYMKILNGSCNIFSPSDLLLQQNLFCTIYYYFSLTSSCQFSLNHTIWSTMPSREESSVGCSSRCMCIIRLQRHIGAVALIGPGSEAPE